MGIAYSTTPMYLSEISPANIRGNLGSMSTVSMKLGTLIEYVIGPFLSVRNLALISLAWLCLFVVAFIWLPESSYYLMRRDAKQKTINSLIQLRGKEDVYKEADSIVESVKADLTNEDSFRELLFVPGNRRALITLMCLSITQQLSGSQSMMQYAQIIFDEINSNLKGKYLTIILGAVQVICTVVCMFITDRSGRKSLLMISAVDSAFSTAMVAAYFHLRYYQVDTSNIVWLPATGVLLYVVMYALGLAAIPFIMAGELFPTNVKALGNTISLMIFYVVSFAVTKLFLVVSERADVHTPFWIFTASPVLYSHYVPETKGKTLEKIQEKLHSKSKQGK